ncbi:single-stranded DNA-binding protein [Streptomyces sp. NRRL F-5135]|uniref:single-stranded DNA-binding protein n=1 Tax=Streptomyces sp. NRRL F-5135 TaxID=1463858 RepID=UPI00099DDDDE|nr:single-stranded DNA-binding protein [Streptomyces sp. NRRL F-5135]
MNDTVVTLVGNVATGVEFRESATGGVARFRFAVTGRRWDRRRSVWADGPTSFYTVWAWRALGANLAASVSVGEPLVVHGRLRVREDERDGQRRTSVEIDAVAAGHDLTRGTSAFRRPTRAAPALTERHENATDRQGQAEGPGRRPEERPPEPTARARERSPEPDRSAGQGPAGGWAVDAARAPGAVVEPVGVLA